MYRLFDVTGIELEYAVVDQALRPLCLVEDAFRYLAGRPVSEIGYRDTGFSNELAAHVFEIKTQRPFRCLVQAEAALVKGVGRFRCALQERWNARLLPTGMHPFMRPVDTRLWPRAGRQIYEAYARIFPIRDHGWLNVQSCHVNLPFGTEVETVRLHNAVACLLPYLPALAASSPVYENRLGPHIDNRLAFYRTNQRRIPQITGAVIPEFTKSYGQYRLTVLQPIYRRLRRFRNGARLRHEWVNSRGAILRFDRSALEIRILDMQECVKMDVAIAVFIRGVLKWMIRRLETGFMRLPPHPMLVRDLGSVIRAGSSATVQAKHFQLQLPHGRRRMTAQSLLLRLLEAAATHTPEAERCYLPLLEWRIRRGNLAERIRGAVERSSAKTPAARRQVITGIYRGLGECLDNNTPWDG